MLRIGRHGANGHLATTGEPRNLNGIFGSTAAARLLWNQSVPLIAERSPGDCQRVLALGRGAQAATSRGEGVCRPVGRGGRGGFREAPARAADAASAQVAQPAASDEGAAGSRRLACEHLQTVACAPPGLGPAAQRLRRSQAYLRVSATGSDCGAPASGRPAGGARGRSSEPKTDRAPSSCGSAGRSSPSDPGPSVTQAPSRRLAASNKLQWST